MTDDFDIKSNAELDELFALKIAGWKFTPATGRLERTQKRGYLSKGRYSVTLWNDNNWSGDIAQIKFCDDANAIRPYLEAFPWDSCYSKVQGINGDYMIRVNGHIARGNSFARTAVIASLRAHTQHV